MPQLESPRATIRGACALQQRPSIASPHTHQKKKKGRGSDRLAAKEISTVKKSRIYYWIIDDISCQYPHQFVFIETNDFKNQLLDFNPTSPNLGFPGGLAGKESICNVGDLGLIPGLGRSPGEGNGYPLKYSGLENSTDCKRSQRVGHSWATFTFIFPKSAS